MFRRLRLSWAKAKALSVLQSAYELPLKEPLDSLDDLDLRHVTAISFDAGGNAFDAAAAFMTYRIKAALEAEIGLGKPVIEGVRGDISKLITGLTRTVQFAKFGALHTQTVAEIGRLQKLADARTAPNSGPT